VTPLQGLARTDLHLLSVFMTIVEQGGFSAAQIALNVSQSTISRQMRDLEIRLGMRLAQRGRTGFRLTDEGRAVYEAAVKLFRAINGFRGEVGAAKGEVSGALSLAVIDNWIRDETGPLIDALAALKRWGPAVHINIHSLPPDEIERAVLDGRADIGIGVFHQHRPGLRYDLMSADPMDLYCGSGHPLFADAGSDAALSQIAGADYVRRSYLSEDRVAPLVSGLVSTATANQMEGVAFLILTGRYVGYLPISYAAGWLGNGRMRSVHNSTYQVETHIESVTRKGVAPSQVADYFMAAVNRFGISEADGQADP